jgi:hypothetical protein
MLNSLAGLAWVAGTRGQLDRAALLPGAGAALSQELGISLVPHAQVHEDACETAAPAGLGEDRYQDTCSRGFALSRQQRVAAAPEDAAPAGRAAPGGAVTELSDRELEVARGLIPRSPPSCSCRARLSRHVSHILSKARPAVARADRRLGRRPRRESSPLIGHLAHVAAAREADHGPHMTASPAPTHRAPALVRPTDARFDEARQAWT